MDNLKLLGIKIENNMQETIKKTKTKYSLNSEKICFGSFNRNLTIAQRADFAKTFIIPKLNFATQVLTFSKTSLTEIQRLINGFIWAGQLERIKLEQTFLKAEKGGLNMRNIKLHCWAIFFKNLALHFFNEEKNANSEAINYWFGELLNEIKTPKKGPIFNHFYFENPKTGETPITFIKKSPFANPDSGQIPRRVPQRSTSEGT